MSPTDDSVQSFHSHDPVPSLRVACLCADWCGTCRDYRVLFEGLQSDFAGRADFVWVDIEDQAALMGGVDVQDFPTLLIAQGRGQGAEVRFFGPVPPHRQALRQLIEHALIAPLVAQVDDEVLALVRRL